MHITYSDVYLYLILLKNLTIGFKYPLSNIEKYHTQEKILFQKTK
jgi:hypothetical protein